ncbi:hypothetical protein LCGC14_0384300 [marine sediment metagenome]|uniref:Uncharacterized protein n=1 Tax=marine sediment metagenome TaxID=412755 RepID=A0A0F9VNJ9_9ZZZZ
MKMIDLKWTKAEIKKRNKPTTERILEGETYPWGLKVHFEKEAVDKMDSLKKVKVGAMVDIHAIGKVVEVSITDRDKSKKRHRVEIQLQQVGIHDRSDTSEKIFSEAVDEED